MPKVRRIPLRMCVGCRAMKPKAELLRVVKSPEGAIAFDPAGKLPGRGAYVCLDGACLKKARKHRGLERALETTIEDAVFDRLEERLDALSSESRD